MPRLLRALLLPRLAPVLLSAACATQTAQPQPPSASAPAAEPAQPHAHGHTGASPATPGPGFTVADVRFMQNMIGHHAQAIDMAALAPRHGASDGVLKLAQKIDISQRDEIELMKQWLKARNQPVPDDAQARAMMMPGMLTPEQFIQLEATRGQAFDRLFLRFMIRHHEGALEMVEELFSSPNAGQDPDLFRFATDVDVDQRDEIFVMQKMLETIPQ